MDVSDLDKMGLVEGLDGDARTKLSSIFRVEELPVGSVLVLEGDLPTKFFIILDGAVTVHRAGHHVADLGAGDFCGEIGVVSLEPRDATVIAVTPVRVAVAMGWDVREAFASMPAIKTQLELAAAARGGGD